MTEERVYVDVLLPLKLDQPFTYSLLVSQTQSIPELGSFVEVPFRGKKVVGVFWREVTSPPSKELKSKIRSVEEVYDFLPLKESLRNFIERVADYTLSPLGLVLKLVLGSSDLLQSPKPLPCYSLNASAFKVTQTASREKVIGFLRQAQTSQTLEQILEATGVSRSVVKSLIEKEVLFEKEGEEEKQQDALFSQAEKGPQSLSFSPDQEEAISSLKKAVEAASFKTILLDGVTGSGKTEVYLEAVFQALQNQKQVLILLPEIALTSQTLRRFEKYFGFSPSVWHSNLGKAERRQTWQGVLKGEVPVVIGARSALFLPFSKLGLIVVDEEHEPAYKQEEIVLYHGRDMAVLRGYLEKIPVVLASATPSLETYVNALEGRYERLSLPERYGKAVLPQIHVVDRRQDQEKEKGAKWLSKSLLTAMRQALDRQEQCLLFLNRRGYAPLTLCGECGERLSCPHCSSWLVEHRISSCLLCHHCGFKQEMPKECPSCHKEESFVACGPGVERLEEEVRSLFPEARLALVTSDQGGVTDRAKELEAIEKGDVDILIGTQMVAKGHHFPNLTLVGGVDADLGLAGGDLRASEKTYQLLHQVAGRAGRDEHNGHVYLQTFMPDHPVLQALVSGDRAAFLEAECLSRQAFEMPPYGRLAALILSGPQEFLVEKWARYLGRYFSKVETIEVLGPAEAPLAKIRNRYRWRLLLKTSKENRLQPYLKSLQRDISLPSSLRLQIDIDPYSFL